jgi:ACS family sodium-dependent inorganic phosphate cotransporter
MIATKFSAKWVMWFAVFINVACTLLTPPSAYVGIWAVVFMRVLEGIGAGVTFPANHTLIAAWAPPQERSTISSIIYAGTALGTVISMLMAGILAEYYGWSSIFYVMGGLSCIWLVLWIIFIQDSPSKQGLISKEERDYIENSLGNTQAHEKPKVIPWKAIFTSKPFLGIFIAHFCSNCGWYMLLIELPIYMNGVLKFAIKENAIYTAIPFLTLWFFSIGISKTLDILKTKNKITTGQARKIATMFASVIPMFCLLALCFIGCRKMAAVVIAVSSNFLFKNIVSLYFF